MVTLKGLLGRIAPSKRKNYTANFGAINVKFPLSAADRKKVETSFYAAEEVFKAVRANLKESAKSAALVPNKQRAIKTSQAAIEVLLQSLQVQRKEWNAAMNDRRKRKETMPNDPVRPLVSVTGKNVDRVLSTTVRTEIMDMRRRIRNLNTALHAMVHNNVPLRAKYGVASATPQRSPRHINSPPNAPATPNLKPRVSTMQVKNNTKSTTTVKVPMSAAEVHLIEQRFIDARDLIETVQMSGTANILRQHGNKTLVDRHSKLKHTVQTYDAALRRQYEAWKPYLKAMSTSVVRYVTLPNWPLHPIASTWVKKSNQRFRVNAREVGLSADVRKTLRNTGAVVSNALKKMTPSFVWVTIPLTAREKRRIDDAFNYMLLYFTKIEDRIEDFATKYENSLALTLQQQIRDDVDSLEHILGHMIRQYDEWKQWTSQGYGKSRRVELPNWPVTPLSRTRIFKSEVSSAAPDVQHELAAINRRYP